MTLQPALMNAILSMGAYNREYGAGILVDNQSPFQTDSAYFVAVSPVINMTLYV